MSEPDTRSDRQDEADISMVRTQTGRPAWQVNGHAAVKSLSHDPRLSDVDPMLPHTRPDAIASTSDSAGEPTDPDLADQAESLGWSRVLRKAFATERIDALRPRIADRVRSLLEGVAAGPRPPDLHSQLSVPTVSFVTCALLDVPQEDGHHFRTCWEAVKTGTQAEAGQGQATLLRYVRALMASRQQGGDDFVSTMLTAAGDNRAYLDRALKFLTSLVSKGRETPTNALDWALVLLLRDPAQYDSLVRDPRLIGPAVEEILRLFPVISGKIQGPEGIRRFALHDFEERARALRRGDLILLNVVGANMDTSVFPEPDRFDPRRTPNPHLTFGYGPHSCPAARLAKIEIQVVVELVVERFPTLRLAIDAEELRFKERPTSEGFDALPVTW
ncbi:cytochrome P450 [Solihabitans fulvus]|uniref:Cytochrome P450 n=1 Tax=Solihabitans fulvus TaxID=1892852 RepID=A0A5B2XQT4_9PSEU|nr:cytochrome P450 [Solihabitans fulvus]KAA2265776.1 cytochrome P450 [Solihabitans fulvus]